MDTALEKYVIIIGAMKSGTTTLFKLLAEHDQIAPAHPKEPGFFAFPEVYAKGFEWYHSLFNFDPTHHVYRLEASTDYTKAPFVTDVWGRMTARPQASYKLIYIMRHPLRRIESHSFHVQRARKEIGQKMSVKSEHGFDEGLSLPSLAMTRYAAQLDLFSVAWTQGDVFLTTLEDLNRSRDQVVNDILTFLDLSPHDLPPEGQVYNKAKGKVVVFRFWEILTSNRLVSKIAHLMLPQTLRAQIRAAFVKQVSLEGRFKLTPTEERAVLDILTTDLDRLRTTYGIDTTAVWDLPLSPADRRA